jgi:hypothetical protein
MRQAEAREQTSVDAPENRLAMWVAIMRALRHVIPYADLEECNRFSPIEEEAGFEPAQFVDFMAAVAVETGIVIPECDYPRVSTLDDLQCYLLERVATAR